KRANSMQLQVRQLNYRGRNEKDVIENQPGGEKALCQKPEFDIIQKDSRTKPWHKSQCAAGNVQMHQQQRQRRRINQRQFSKKPLRSFRTFRKNQREMQKQSRREQS